MTWFYPTVCYNPSPILSTAHFEIREGNIVYETVCYYLLLQRKGDNPNRH